MTARNFPAATSSLTKRTFSFVYFGIGSVTFLSPIQRVKSASGGTCHMNPRSVSMYTPPGSSERRQRLNECLPTASKTTS